MLCVCEVTAPAHQPTYLSVVNTQIYDEAEECAFCLVPNLHRQTGYFSLKEKNYSCQGFLFRKNKAENCPVNLLLEQLSVIRVISCY